MVKKDTWVSLRKVILEPGERAEGIPENTASTPLIMWVSGFLERDSDMGRETYVRTKMNRIETGVLEEVAPTAIVNYGEYVPEIAHIGMTARKILRGEA